jgi:hypothetical protein
MISAGQKRRIAQSSVEGSQCGVPHHYSSLHAHLFSSLYGLDPGIRGLRGNLMLKHPSTFLENFDKRDIL